MKRQSKGAHVKSIKRKNKKVENIPTKFWNEYSELDYFERRKKIYFIVKSIINYDCIKDEKMREQAISSHMQSYFDDIIEVFKK